MTIWRMIPHHEDRESAIEWCQEHSAIAMGWGKTGDLRDLDMASLGQEVRLAYANSENHRTASPSLQRIMEIEVGDLIVLAGRGGSAHAVEVTGPYRYASERDSFEDYQHQRPVRFTDLDPTEFWTTGVADGENTRWTLARVSKPSSSPLTEGARREVTSTAIERKPQLRRACIAHHGYRCKVCGLNFEERYGDIGHSFIHVHHLTPLAEMHGPNEVDPIRDMVPLCPNCHAMIHKGLQGPFTVEELQGRIRQPV